MQTGTNFSESFQTIYEDDSSFLETMVKDHPASPLSLFLLLQHYKNGGDSRYAALAKKASLYFQNPAWLNYQLSGDELMKGIEESSELKEEASAFPEPEDESEPIETREDYLPENISGTGTDLSSENIVEQEAIHEMEQEEKVEFVQGEEIPDFEKSFVENEPKEALVQEEIRKEDEKMEEDSGAEAEVAPTEENTPEVNTKEDTISTTETEVPNEDDGSGPEETGFEETTISKPAQNLPESINLSPESAAPKKEESQELEFEPLHTIDYFASQGIIIKEEALMNDKLGKQVKSFTDWLKSMKKLHPGKLPEQNEVVERIIQSSAELSNEDAGILTESMAEVLLKQGKSAKAIEMFEKLSLMNPSKSSYFAAKIESLKNK